MATILWQRGPRLRFRKTIENRFCPTLMPTLKWRTGELTCCAYLPQVPDLVPKF